MLLFWDTIHLMLLCIVVMYVTVFPTKLEHKNTRRGIRWYSDIFSLPSAFAHRHGGLVEEKAECRDGCCVRRASDGDENIVKNQWKLGCSAFRSPKQAAGPRPVKMPALRSFPNPARSRPITLPRVQCPHWWLKLSCIPSSDDYRSARETDRVLSPDINLWGLPEFSFHLSGTAGILQAAGRQLLLWKALLSFWTKKAWESWR